MKQRIRLTEGQLHRVIKESVKRVLKESTSRKEIFTISGFNNTQDEGVEMPMYLFGYTYYSYDDAREAAEKAASYYSEDEDDIDVFVMVGEYETANGGIFGEPDAFECCNNHKGWR